MIKFLTFLIALFVLTSLFQTKAIAYTDPEETTVSIDDLDSPFLPKLPLADLVKPVKVLSAPTAIDQVTMEPTQDEILTGEDDNAFLRTEIPPPTQL